MSTEAAEIKVKKSEPLFSKKNKKLVTNPLDIDNPITVQVLGICSALAITTQMRPAFVMTIAVVVVCASSNVMISLMRNTVPSRIRIIVQLAIVSLWVTLVNEVLKAYVYDVSKQLSVFVGLIITNCIIMGRLEAFAMSNKPGPSLLDGIGNGLGYGLILMLVAFFREFLGSGSVFGFKVWESIGLHYPGNGLMLLPAGACIIVGLIIWIQRSLNGFRETH